MIAFLISPALTFFSRRLYQEVLKSGAGRGFLYLSYLTALFCVLGMFLSRTLIAPVVEDYAQWFVSVTPEMTMTEKGLSAQVKQPYLVSHPAIGPLYLIDTTKSGQQLLNDPSGALIVVAQDQMIIRQPGQAEMRIVDFANIRQQLSQSKGAVRITKQVLWDFVKRLQDMMYPIMLLIAAVVFFIWKLISALLYSVVALVMSRFRKAKLQYRNLFALSCHAITPVTVLQVMSFSIPETEFNLSLLIAVVLTSCYIAYAIFSAYPESSQK
jgi:hypothetical protein